MREITPINNNGSILLRFTHDGERYALTPVRGAKYSDQWDLRRVEAIARWNYRFMLRMGGTYPFWQIK